MVLRVETPVAEAARWLERLDMLTLLGTAIGVKGHGLNPAATDRLQEAGRLIAASGRRIILAGDGCIRDTTVPLLRAAGAETVVVGSLAFGSPILPSGWPGCTSCSRHVAEPAQVQRPDLRNGQP